MSQQSSANLKDSGGGGSKNLAGSDGGVDQPSMRGSAERLDEVVLSDSTGTVGLIFIEQKDGIVVLMCVISPYHFVAFLPSFPYVSPPAFSASS
jgi:hypothetical protein